MKKTLITISFALLALCASADEVMKKTDDGTYVVNSTTLCNARGYRNTTPVEVYIKEGKVTKVVTLANKETPTIFARVKKCMLPLFDEIKISKAKKLTSSTMVDGCTGATYSMKAVQQNITAAIKYYETHK